MVYLPEPNKKKEPTRMPPKKVPSYHLTSSRYMEFIKEADARAKAKEEKDRKIDLVKKEAVKNLEIKKEKQIQKEKNSYLLEPFQAQCAKHYPLDFLVT